MLPKILGLAGPSGSGKDEVADLLSRFGYRKLKIANQIRQEFSDFLEDALIRAADKWHLPSHFQQVITAYLEAIYNKPTSPESRVALQWWGTEYRRAVDPDYWTKNLGASLQDGSNVAISDVRILIERDLIHSVGGEVWWIHRPGLKSVGLPGHATENGLRPEDCDRIIKNDSTLKALSQTIDRIFHANLELPFTLTNSGS